VATLLRDQTRADNLLLRLALAERSLGSPAATAHVEALRDRFASSAQRGESLHLREESRFVLAVENDPQRALALAAANWKVQREPADLRVLLEAALAANDPAAAAPALAFLDATHLEDRALTGLRARLQ